MTEYISLLDENNNFLEENLPKEEGRYTIKIEWFNNPKEIIFEKDIYQNGSFKVNEYTEILYN